MSNESKVLGGKASDMVQPSLPPENSGKTAEQLSQEAKERILIAEKAAADQVVAGAKAAEAQPSGSVVNMTREQLESEIKRILGTKSTGTSHPAEVIPEPKVPEPEPDWASLTELEATDLRRAINVPLIMHEIPAYLDIKLKDNEYVAVWANRDQRRIGALEAEGYEFLRREHLAGDFKLPLKFDSEGLYIYADVVAMRVHKRILFGKRRRTQELSQRQLRGAQQIAQERTNSELIQKDPNLEGAFHKGSLQYYDVNI
jgi:hypothetical protein